MADPCPACGRPSGSNGGCRTCRDAAARDLAREARDVTDDALPRRAEAGRRFAEHPPWWARLAPGSLLRKVGLAARLIGDYAAGRYRIVPWRSIAVLAAALAYVVSPLDLIPDLLVPVGWTDDLLVLALAWSVVKRDLRDYCAWKGLSPAEFGL
ncbi:MAG TPA: DUF1232 domain-containing protein [Anaeromyxobacteraceae bacterium]|nr:DUF1232 domain-containing protein [Anaeromyxobacteraceae bacterium]